MFIQLGIINYKLIIPLIYPIFYQIRFKISKSDNGCYELFINFLSYSLAGVIFLIVRYNTKKLEWENSLINRKTTTTKLTEETIQIDAYNGFNNLLGFKEFEEKKEKRKKKELLKLKIFVVSLAIINLIPMSYEVIGHNTLDDILDLNLKQSSSIFFAILFYTTLSMIFLGHKIYNHQKLSLAIISICMIFVFSSYIIENGLDFNKIMNILYFGLIFGFYALYNVIGKKIFDSFIISPYYLMFSIGIISLAILLPFEIISYLIDPKWEYNGIIRIIFKHFSVRFLIRFISSVVVGFFWLGGIWLTVYYFTPNHFIVSESLSQLLTSLIDGRHISSSIITEIIIYGIIIFSSLIYNEIIIIKNEIISKDTKIYIMKRQNTENELIENAKKMEDISIPEEDKNK